MMRRAICLLAVGAAALSAGLCRGAEEASNEATQVWDFANGLYIRGRDDVEFYRQAAAQYREFLTRFPQDTRAESATFRLGESHRLAGDFEAALAAYVAHQKFAESPNRATVNFRTGQVLHTLKRNAEAIAFLDKVVAAQVDDNLKVSAWFYLGRAHLDNGGVDKAIEVLTPLGDRDNAYRAYANLYLGYALVAKKMYDDAAARFTKAAELSQTLAAEASLKIGEIRALQERYGEARAAYEAVTTRFPESPMAREALYGVMWTLWNEKKYAEVVTFYETKGNALAGALGAKARYLHAAALYEVGRYADAQKVFKALVSDPAAKADGIDGKAAFKVGWAAFMANDYAGAIESARAFLKAYPDSADTDKVVSLLAEAHYKSGKVPEALALYTTVVEKHPNSAFVAEARYGMGVCQARLEQFAAARETFRAFAKTYPAHDKAAHALVRAAECSLRLKEEDAAAADYEALIATFPNAPLVEEALFQLGIVYVERQKNDEAIDRFARLVEKFPASKHASDAYYWIGSAKQAKGELDAALDFLRKSIETSKDKTFLERAQLKVATIYRDKKQDAEAAKVLLDLIQQNPGTLQPATHLWVGDFLREAGQIDTAKGVYESFLKNYKDTQLDEWAYFGLGECALAQQQWAEASGFYGRAIEKRGKYYFDARLSGGVAALQLGKLDEAEKLLLDVAKCEAPALEARAFYRLGMVHTARAEKEADQKRRKEHLEEAQRLFQRVYILYEGLEVCAEAMYRSGEVFEALGKRDAAQAEYKKLVETFPQDPFAAKAKERLDEAAKSGGT